MKKRIAIAFFTFLLTSEMWSQAPKYVLFEHFTNTRCGICGGTNPTFYNNISVTTNPKLHHISMHSSFRTVLAFFIKPIQRRKTPVRTIFRFRERRALSSTAPR
jgi:hypothetical protein